MIWTYFDSYSSIFFKVTKNWYKQIKLEIFFKTIAKPSIAKSNVIETKQILHLLDFSC